MSDIQAHFNDNLRELIDRTTDPNASPDEAIAAAKILKLYTEIHLPDSALEPTPDVLKTRWARFKAGAKAVLDNETARAIIKAGGALAGVVVVTRATIEKDHVVERQALAQANQRPS